MQRAIAITIVIAFLGCVGMLAALGEPQYLISGLSGLSFGYFISRVSDRKRRR